MEFGKFYFKETHVYVINFNKTMMTHVALNNYYLYHNIKYISFCILQFTLASSAYPVISQYQSSDFNEFLHY